MADRAERLQGTVGEIAKFGPRVYGPTGTRRDLTDDGGKLLHEPVNGRGDSTQLPLTDPVEAHGQIAVSRAGQRLLDRPDRFEQSVEQRTEHDEQNEGADDHRQGQPRHKPPEPGKTRLRTHDVPGVPVPGGVVRRNHPAIERRGVHREVPDTVGRERAVVQAGRNLRRKDVGGHPAVRKVKDRLTVSVQDKRVRASLLEIEIPAAQFLQEVLLNAIHLVAGGGYGVYLPVVVFEVSDAFRVVPVIEGGDLVSDTEHGESHRHRGEYQHRRSRREEQRCSYR